MVRVFPYLILVSFVWAFPIEPQEKCKGEMIEKVDLKGLRSLKISEIPVYMKELRSCNKEDKEKLKKIKKSAEDIQLADDADKSKTFVGRTSGLAYCVLAFIAYLALV